MNDRAEISADELVAINLDDLSHLDHEGLRTHFASLAARATDGQLVNVLGVNFDDPICEMRDSLVDEYIRRKVALAERLRQS